MVQGKPSQLVEQLCRFLVNMGKFTVFLYLGMGDFVDRKVKKRQGLVQMELFGQSSKHLLFQSFLGGLPAFTSLTLLTN